MGKKKITAKFNADFIASDEIDEDDLILYFQNTPVEDLIKKTEVILKEELSGNGLESIKILTYSIEVKEIKHNESEVNTSVCESTV